MTEQTQLPPTVEDLSPSARYIYTVLQHADEALTVRELASRTGYSLRTIRTGTHELLSHDIITEEFEAGDARRKRFALKS